MAGDSEVRSGAAGGAFGKLVARWREEEAAARARAGELRGRIAQEARAVFERYRVQRAVLFGSVADGRCRAGSDVDLLVLSLRAEDYCACWRELEAALGAPVDLHTDTDDPAFVQKVLARGETVYEAQR